MAFELPDVRESVNSKLQDDASFITSPEKDNCIQDALRKLNKDDPRDFVFDTTGDGTQDYDIESNTNYQRGFSVVKRVEHPAGENPPRYLKRLDDWIIYEDPSKPSGSQIRLRFIAVTPAATEIIRTTITGPHEVTQTTSTHDQTSFLAHVFLSLVLIYRSLAAKYDQSADPSIEADVVSRSAIANNFLFLAERYNTDYKALAGLSAQIKASQAFGEVDITFVGGEPMFWRRNRDR